MNLTLLMFHMIFFCWFFFGQDALGLAALLFFFLLFNHIHVYVAYGLPVYTFFIVIFIIQFHVTTYIRYKSLEFIAICRVASNDIYEDMHAARSRQQALMCRVSLYRLVAC